LKLAGKQQKQKGKTMTNAEIEKTKAQIKRHEGLRLEAYKDSLGYLTIGYGHLLSKKADPAAAEMAVTKAEADQMFEGDYKAAEADAKKLLLCWDNLSAPRQAVMINMAFNLGFEGLKGFAQTISHIEGRRYNKAADAMLASKWAKQVGRRSLELARQMKTGEWQ
jgi:lysozyme